MLKISGMWCAAFPWAHEGLSGASAGLFMGIRCDVQREINVNEPVLILTSVYNKSAMTQGFHFAWRSRHLNDRAVMRTCLGENFTDKSEGSSVKKCTCWSWHEGTLREVSYLEPKEWSAREKVPLELQQERWINWAQTTKSNLPLGLH